MAGCMQACNYCTNWNWVLFGKNYVVVCFFFSFLLRLLRVSVCICMGLHVCLFYQFGSDKRHKNTFFFKKHFPGYCQIKRRGMKKYNWSKKIASVFASGEQNKLSKLLFVCLFVCSIVLGLFFSSFG